MEEEIKYIDIKIAFTGHRDLDLTHYCEKRQELKAELLSIQKDEPAPPEGYKNKFIVVFGNAIGADRIAMDVCNEIGLTTEIITSKGYKSKDYNIVADKIIKDANYLVTMWDKTFNGKMGGTSDIVDRFNKVTNKTGYLYQKLKSVEKNEKIKIIKVKRLPHKEENKIKIKNGLLLTGSIFSFFIVFDILNQTGLSTTMAGLETILSLAKKSFYASLFPALFFFGVWYLYKSVSNIKSLFLEFLFPLSIIVYTLITGTIGFKQHGFNLGDSFFGAANLLTLNSSVFNTYDKLEDYSKVCLWLINARIFGGIFLAYAFFLAFSKATGRENIDRLKFRISRTYSKLLKITSEKLNKSLGEKNAIRFKNSIDKLFPKREFIVVIGNSIKAYNLANHSSEQGQKVVFLYDGESEKIDASMEEKNIYFMKGSSTSRLGLKKTFFQDAAKVYVLHDNDEDNFRTTQEMIEIQQEKKDEYPEGNWVVHLSDVRKRDMLISLKDNLPEVHMKCFNINENIARRLVFSNDASALSSNSISTYQIVFFGFNTLVEDITLQYLRVGHFTKGKHLQIKIYYQKAEFEKVQAYKESYPFLFGKCKNYDYKIIVDYTFLHDRENIIDFEELPIAESALISSNFSLYKLFTSKSSAIYIYSCLENGVQSAALLKTLLPRISNSRKNEFLKVYCYYNYLDPQEELNVQRSLCETTMCQVPVTCFGNDLINCQASEIDDEQRDQLAKYFAYFYHQLYMNNRKKPEDENVIPDDVAGQRAIAERIFKEVISEFPAWESKKIIAFWLTEPEMYKDSNKQAADHAIIKRGLMGKAKPDSLQDFTKFWTEGEVAELAEVEHRRWNAEKLLLGWQPVDEKAWKTNSKKLKQQKFHHWLKDFEELPEVEKDKDRTQILGLPYFLWEIDKNKNL